MVFGITVWAISLNIIPMKSTSGLVCALACHSDRSGSNVGSFSGISYAI